MRLGGSCRFCSALHCAGMMKRVRKATDDSEASQTDDASAASASSAAAPPLTRSRAKLDLREDTRNDPIIAKLAAESELGSDEEEEESPSDDSDEEYRAGSKKSDLHSDRKHSAPAASAADSSAAAPPRSTAQEEREKALGQSAVSSAVRWTFPVAPAFEV
jgi:hypothetical protein